MGNKDNPTIRQHFVPQFLIKKFCNTKNMVECYSIEKDKWFPAHSYDICFKKKLYECEEILFINEIENILCKMEKETSISLNKVLKALDRYDLEYGDCKIIPLDYLKNEIEILIIYMVIQIMRSPIIIENLSYIVDGSIKYVDELNNIVSNEEVVKNADKEELDKALKAIGLELFFKDKKIISYIYSLIRYNHKIVFFRSEKLHFLSADEPIAMQIDEEIIEENGQNLFLDGDFFFALSPNYCLGLLKPIKGYEDILNEEFALRKINYKIYNMIITLLLLQTKKLIFSDKIDEKVVNIINKIKD